MKSITILILIASTVLFISFQKEKDNRLTKAEKKAGWKLLFDGKSMNGWRTFKNKTSNSWEAVGGELHCKGSTTDKSDVRADLITTDQYENFELSVDWKISKKGNSGIMYHVTEEYNAAYLTGPEYQLIDDEGFPEKLEEWQKTGADYAMYTTTSRPVNPVGEYNNSKIVFNKGHVEHWLNGVKVVEFEAWSDDWNHRKATGKWKDAKAYGMAKTGFICLQDHGSETWFKNIKIKPLH
jgi:hypothetical protein